MLLLPRTRHRCYHPGHIPAEALDILLGEFGKLGKPCRTGNPGGEGECPPTLPDVVVREARGFLMDKKNLPVVIGGAVGAFIVIWLLCVACMHCRGGSGSAKSSEPAVAAPVDRDSTTFAGSTERTQFISAGGAGPSDADEEHGRQPEA